MSWQLVYVWSKKIHRIAMWLCILLGVPLAVTGVIMEDEGRMLWAASLDFGYKVRELHRMASSKFALVLAIMMITGFVMWAIPIILKKRAMKEQKHEQN